MARAVDADALQTSIGLYMAENAYLNDTPLDILKMLSGWIDEQPTIEAEPVKRGKWEKVADLCGIEVLKCSVCGVERPRLASKYCCDCGARMDGDSE